MESDDAQTKLTHFSVNGVDMSAYVKAVVFDPKPPSSQGEPSEISGVKSLPSFTFSGTWDIDMRTCTICKGTFKAGPDLAVLTENGHRIGNVCPPCVKAITA